MGSLRTANNKHNRAVAKAVVAAKAVSAPAPATPSAKTKAKAA
ncbi:MAG: hypothetical protein ABW128_14890 [Rhizorhabdus sp.]